MSAHLPSSRRRWWRRKTPTSHTLRGSTTTIAGSRITGVEAFLLESLDAAKTDHSGRFLLRTAAQGSVTLVARCIGYAPATVNVLVDTGDDIAVTLRAPSAVLAPIAVQAGVRGGVVSETKALLLNNTVMLPPYNYGAPTGDFTVTVNPFPLDGIFFSSSGSQTTYTGVAASRACRPRPMSRCRTV